MMPSESPSLHHNLRDQVLLYTAFAGLFTLVPTFYIEAAYKKVFYQVCDVRKTGEWCVYTWECVI